MKVDAPVAVDTFDRAMSLAYLLAYVVACGACVLVVFPGFRMQLAGWWQRQVYSWRSGRQPVPSWYGLTIRQDLPEEPS